MMNKNIDLDVCMLCSGDGYLKLPVNFFMVNDKLIKTELAHKICPACKGHKRNLFKFPFSLEACEWLEDYICK